MSTDTEGHELEGQVAIVTGSAINTGRTIVQTLAAAGAAVVVNYRSSADAAREAAREIEAEGGQALVYRADVTIAEEVEAMTRAAAEAFGGIDILVNNANVRSYSPLVEITPELWQTTLATTLTGAFHCARSCVPHMIARGRGTIVNMGGGSGHSGVANRCHVATAKGGLAAMTGALAVELAPHGITVNCIVPGRVDTGKRDTGSRHRAERGAGPMGRSARRQEIAGLVRFLCGEGCRYISGQMLHVNGARYVTIA